jgi:hypothetical protein
MDPNQQGNNQADDRDPNPFSSKKVILGDAMMFNMKQLELFHIVMYMAGGTIAGILGVTGKWGIVIILLTALLSTIGLLIRMKFNIHKYSNFTFFTLATTGITSQSLTFIFFWTFAYTMVHIY